MKLCEISRSIKMESRWPGAGGTRSARVVDPAQDVPGDRHQRTVLIGNADIGERLAFLRIDLRDSVGDRDRVADRDGSQEPYSVIAQRDRRLAASGALAFIDHQGGAGRHV